MFRSLAAALAAALVGAIAPAAAQTAFEAAVMINDEVVTRYDIEQRARLLRVNGAPDTPELGRIALQQLVDDRLKRSAARAQGLEAPEAALDEAVAQYAASRDVSVPALEARLRRFGVDRAALEDALATDILWRETIRARFGPRAVPSEAEIDQEVALAAAGRAASYRLAEIAIPIAARGEAETLALAERLSRELNAGGDFAAAARRYSAAPSARRGGEIGWVPERALPPEATSAVAGLPPGGVSAPIEAPGAIALLKLIERRVEAAPWARETEVTLLALRAPGATVGALRERAAEAAEEGGGCDGIGPVAAALGLEVERRPPETLAALPTAVRTAVAALDIGALSEVAEGPAGPTAYVLCDRTGGADAETRERLRDEIRQQRLQRFAAAYLEELRAEAVIEER